MRQVLRHYPFIVSLDSCVESCNIIDDPYDRICVSNKTGDVNSYLCNMITGVNEVNTSIKHISCNCRCTFNDIICNSNHQWNN